jgi:hypothetical protein
MRFALRRTVEILILFQIFLFVLKAQFSFPLATGNVWYYEHSCYWCQQPVLYQSLTIKVVGDTLMPNGKRYWILEPRDFFGNQYLRSDSSFLYNWSQYLSDTNWSERQLFNFHAKVNERDTIRLGYFISVTARQIDTMAIFGKQSNVIGYSLDGLVMGSIAIADGFGYLRYEYQGDGPGPIDIWSLVGCVIEDTLYGRTVSVGTGLKIPNDIRLYQNYPNPFNGGTTFKYSLSQTEQVCVDIITLLGQCVGILYKGYQPSGYYTAQFNPKNLSSGVYFCRLTTSTSVHIVRFLYLK